MQFCDRTDNPSFQYLLIRTNTVWCNSRNYIRRSTPVRTVFLPFCQGSRSEPLPVACKTPRPRCRNPSRQENVPSSVCSRVPDAHVRLYALLIRSLAQCTISRSGRKYGDCRLETSYRGSFLEFRLPKRIRVD